MKLSKYFKITKIDNKHFAIYNSILFQIMFVNYEELEKVKNMQLNKGKTKIMLEKGIYVEKHLDIEKTYKYLRSEIEKKSRIPSIMYIDVSTYCNLACKYCFIENNPLSVKKCEKMKYSVAKISVDKFLFSLKKNKVKSAQIIFYGGEPLTNWRVVKETIEYIRKTKDINIVITIITNGTLINKNILTYLKNQKIGIGISIDGPKDLNDKNRIYKNGNKSVFECVMKSIKLMNKMNCNYCVSATITPDIVANKNRVIEWLKNSEIKNVFWNLYHYSKKNNIWKKHYEEMSDFIVDTYNVLLENNITEEKIKEQIELFSSDTFKFHSCGAVGLNQITVKPNGDVCICQGDSKSNKNIVGNIIIDEIEDILNNKKNNKWLKLYTINRKKCKFCEAISICGGGCPLQADALFGKRSKLDKASCIYYKKLLKWLIKESYYATMNSKRG